MLKSKFSYLRYNSFFSTIRSLCIATIIFVTVVENKPILSVFQLMLLEHIVMCRLVMGNKSTALAEISQACQLCRQQPKLLQGHRPQLHTLIGLYAMSMNCMEAAEAQFLAALRVSSVIDLKRNFSPIFSQIKNFNTIIIIY